MNIDFPKHVHPFGHAQERPPVYVGAFFRLPVSTSLFWENEFPFHTRFLCAAKLPSVHANDDPLGSAYAVAHGVREVGRFSHIESKREKTSGLEQKGKEILGSNRKGNLIPNRSKSDNIGQYRSKSDKIGQNRQHRQNRTKSAESVKIGRIGKIRQNRRNHFPIVDAIQDRWGGRMQRETVGVGADEGGGVRG